MEVVKITGLYNDEQNMIINERLGKNELKEKFIKLRAKGHSYRDIEDILGISKSTLSNWNSELEEEIARLKAIELDALYQQFYMSKKSKIELLGNILNQMKEEVINRDLSEVETDRLLELIIKYKNELEKEKVDIKPLSNGEVNLLKDKNGTNVDSSVTEEISKTLLKFRVGIIDKEQFSKEIYALKSKLKAIDQERLEKKIDKIQDMLERKEDIKAKKRAKEREQ